MGNMSGSYGGNYTLYQTLLQNSQNINNNTTNVTIRLVLSFDGKNYSYTYDTSYGYMIINGNRYDYSIPNIIFSSGQAKDLVLAEWTGDIPHNSDGTKILDISGYWDTGTSRIGSGSTNSSVALNTIPRTSSISCTTANVGEPAIVTISSASSSFRHSVYAYFGSLYVIIATEQAGGIISWTIPENFYTQIPNAKSGIGTIYCETFNNGVLLGVKTAQFTVTTNEEKCKPTLSATVKDINETTITLTGDENKLIKYRSTAQISISTSAKNSATIVSKKINNTVVTNDINNITNIETNTFDIVSTDSRGYSTSLTLSPEIINYIPLSINAIVRRIQPTTGEVGITFTGNYFNSSFGSIENTLSIKWYYKESSSEEYVLGGDLTPVIKDNTFSNGDSEIILGDFFDYQKSYNIQLEIVDKLTTLNPTYTISQGIPVFNWGKDFFNIYGELQVKEQNILEIIFPIGHSYVTQSADINPKDILGFGEWERVKGRVLVGIDENDPNFNTFGQEGGEKEHTLTVNEIPSHNHTMGINQVGGNYSLALAGLYVGEPMISRSGWATGNNGGNQSHNNLQPYKVVGYMWIRIS